MRTDGLTEEKGTASAWFGERPTGPMPVEGVWERVPTADWSEKWKEGLEPVTAGPVTILPPWLAEDGPRLDQPPYIVVIEPGMAFGTGHHETTRACLLALSALDLQGARLADIGTGTGVLALAAVALGATDVVGVDTDPLAIEVATANVAAHEPADGPRLPIALRVGSCEVVGEPADVVVANIITDKLLALAPDLVGLLAPGGTLLCSGIAVDRRQEAVEVFAGLGVVMTAQAGDEWAVLSS